MNNAQEGQSDPGLTYNMQQQNENENVLTKEERQIQELQRELKEAKSTIAKLQWENELLQERCREYEAVPAEFSVDRFKDDDDSFQFYTGLPSYGVFKALLDYLGPASQDEGMPYDDQPAFSRRGRKTVLSTEDQLVLVMVRLKLGLFQKDLGHRFGIHQSTMSRLCTDWINFLYLRLCELPLWATREIVDKNMPRAFVDKYPRTRVIIDATEIRCEVPSSFVLQSETYSNYKSCNTFKGLVGISPDGLVTFVSALATGSISDRELVKKSGFLSLPFTEGDVVMADKGFTIGDLLEPLKVELNIPPFLRQQQFAEDDVLQTEAIASLHIHVECRIQRIKIFHIFDRRIPITMAPLIDQLWTVCVILTNFQSSLIKDT
ncbi:uncharacterized protein LOC135372472 [Ornithodoros turicata]|uniref:uncharacterized protein LOC135372472 n=1 Tax=Ornithodoros turicata TaxID=34597 RepID=UPI003139F676